MAVLKDLIVHGASRFLNGASFNTINAESIGANQGIFNKLIATTLDAKEAIIDNLTAQNATVVGLLDVQGELHTNSWTNANIANIGGSFYISPTVEPTDGTTTISITRNSVTSWTVSAAGTFATDFVKSGTATSGVTWPANSLVLITGDVVVGDMVYPLGTLKGTLSAQVTATAASTSKTITITGVTDAQNNTSPSVLQTLYELNNNANISNAAFKNGKISLYKLGSNPIGILLSSMGTSSNSIIDIYGGVSTSPNVRIGHLAGLPNVNGSAPTGWGIYTDNGYFSGVIVSTSGKIANFTINDSKMYSNGKTSYSAAATNGGIYIGDDYISFGDGTKTYFYKDGTGQIGPWTLSTTYIRNGNIANATNTSVSGVYLGTDGLNISNGTAATTSYITKSAVNIGNKLTWNGSILKVDGEITASKLTISSGATIGGDGANQILNSNIAIGGRNLLLNTTVSTSNISKIRANTSYTSVVTEDGIICYKITGSSTAHLFNGTDAWDCMAEKLKANTTYTYSAWIKSSKGGTLSHTFLGHYNVSNSASTASDKTHEDTNRIYYPKTIVANTWTKISVTFTTNSLVGSSFGVYPVYNTGSDTILYIYGFMLEEGNIASNWTPAPEDVQTEIDAASKVATNNITQISQDGIWITPYSKQPTNTSTGAGATGTKIDATNGVSIYKDGIKLAEYGASTKWYSPDGQHLAAKIENNANYGSLMVINHLAVSSSSSPSVNDMWIGPGGIETTRSYEDGSTWAESTLNINGGKISMDSIKSDSTGLIGSISIEPGRILASSYANSPVEANIRTASAAGSIYMYSQPTSSGNRGIYAIDPSNVYKAVIDITPDNLCYFRGTADSISDLKRKDVIADYDWKIDDFINGLKPIAYRFKHDDGSLGDRIRMGFGAQDVRDLTRSLYDEELSLYRARIIDETKEGTERERLYHGEDIDDEKLLWSLTYEELIAPIVLEIQRLMARIDKLESEIKVLKS